MIPTESKSKITASKREDVKAFLRLEARAIGGGCKLPTVLELCGKLDVAKATVNSALDELQDEGILRRRRGSGIYVSEQIDQKCIALVFGKNIFSTNQSPFCSMVLERSRERAASHDETFSFFFDIPLAGGEQTYPVHLDLADAFERNRLHGVLLVSWRSLEQVGWLKAQGVPVVTLTASPMGSNCVGPDYSALVRMGARALAGQGCRRIGLISALDLLGDGKLQTAVFREELTELGLPEHDGQIWLHPDTETSEMSQMSHEEQGYWALMKLLETDRNALDGVVINDDMMARGALAAARKLGLTVGSELKIATHANKGALTLTGHESHITRLEVDPDKLVEAMFGILERLMAGGKSSRKPHLIYPELRIGSNISFNN